MYADIHREIYMIYEFNIPLFYRVHDTPGNGGFPDVYPFRLKFDASTGIPSQAGTVELNEILRKIYSQGLMMTGSMDSDDLVGGIHAACCLAFTHRASPTLRGKRVLEIGCGQGVILSELSRHGAECVGLEPGRQIRRVAGEGIRLINDFFPTSLLEGQKFDMISSFNVIEHVENLSYFLEAVNDSLDEGGDFVFCVPNCGPYLASGDISILLHEHFNYFSEENIASLLNSTGFSVEMVEVSNNTALLMVHAKKGRATDAREKGDRLGNDGFIESMIEVKGRVESSMDRFDDDEIAVYCPNRALNLMSQLGRKMIRIVEDTPIALGRYYPYFSKPVENFGGLVAHPTKSVYVFSYTHGEMLRERCWAEPALKDAKIFVISDFY